MSFTNGLETGGLDVGVVTVGGGVAAAVDDSVEGDSDGGASVDGVDVVFVSSMQYRVIPIWHCKPQQAYSSSMSRSILNLQN